MQLETITSNISEYVTALSLPTRLVWTDALEIVIIAFLVYSILLWISDTKAWNLLKGIVVILVFLLLAAIFNLSTILWIAEKILNIAVVAIVVVFQPELRRALDQLGSNSFLKGLLPVSVTSKPEGIFSDGTIDEIVKACFAMGRVRTGALIVVEQHETLSEYEQTGIAVDAAVSNQLLINIFEHNTPLHDGAVLVRGDRVVSATCYLPLSESKRLSKELGTRHRAGVGISEVTDSMTIIVSEETGHVSVAYRGELTRNVDVAKLTAMLESIQNKPVAERSAKGWKGRWKREEK